MKTFLSLFTAGGEARGEAKVGVPTARQAAKRHCSRLSRRFRALRHGQEAGHVRPLQPRSEGQDAEDRLSPASRQGKSDKTYGQDYICCLIDLPLSLRLNPHLMLTRSGLWTWCTCHKLIHMSCSNVDDS